MRLSKYARRRTRTTAHAPPRRRYQPFGAGSGERIQRDFGVPNLVRFPNMPDLSAAGDGEIACSKAAGGRRCLPSIGAWSVVAAAPAPRGQRVRFAACPAHISLNPTPNPQAASRWW